MKGQPLHRRVGFAMHGVWLAFNREHSFRFHVLAAAGVLCALVATRPAPIWWAIAALATGLVLVAELINTALENLVDHLHPERHPEIGAVKDIAAGAVLVASIIAVSVAVAFVAAMIS